MKVINVFVGDAFPSLCSTYGFPELYRSPKSQIDVARFIVNDLISSNKEIVIVFTNSPFTVKGISKFAYSLTNGIRIRWFYDKREVRLNEIFKEFSDALTEVF